MVTKRTRLLSIVMTALMLVTMLAYIVIPASAEGVTIGDLVAKYEILDPANFNEEGAAQIEAARAQLATYAAQYDAQEDEAVRASILEGAIAYEASITEALQGTVNADAELPYANKGYYEALGYTTEATTYLITNYEDWMAVAAAAKGWSGVTFKVTADIDFTGKTAAPLVPACSTHNAPEYQFMGTLDGQGHKLINMNLALTGCYAAVVAGNAKNATVKNLGIEGGTLAFTKAGADWFSYGSFLGRSEGGCKLINCWSTMAITGANGDGKTGTGGLLGMGESGDVIDNCFFAGSITNTAGPATDTVGYGGGVSGTKVYNTIGAGTLVASTNPVAAGGWHSNVFGDAANAFTGAQDGTSRQVFYNSYAVGHDAIRFRGNAVPYTHSGATYFNEDIFSAAAVNKVHSAASLEEAAWTVNNNFNTKYQESQTYFFDVVDGELCFTTNANATLKKVTITGDAEASTYLHAGETVNLVSDLGLQAEIADAYIEGYEDAIDASWNLTVPNADVIVEITYDEDAILGAAVSELEEILAKYDAIDFDLFTEGEGEMAEWYDYAVEGIENEDIDQIKDAIDWETELTVELKDGAYPPFAKYDDYKAFNPAGWGISNKADWLAYVAKTNATDGSAANFLDLDLYVTSETDIDFGGEDMYPAAWGFIFTGSLNGNGKVFKNVSIKNPGNGDNGVALIAKVNGVVIRDLGITGTVTSTATSTYGGCAAAFVGVQDGALEVYNCWNGADVTAVSTKYAFAAGLVSNCNNKALKIVGFYNLGNISANTQGGGAGAVWASGTSHGLTIAAHVYNAGTLTGSATRMWRSNISAGYPARNYITNNAAYLNDSYYANTEADLNAGRWDAGIVLAEDNGAYGYTLNQRATGLTDKSGALVPAVYWTVENGVSVFGTEANQTRKVEFTGSVSGDRYFATGAEIDLNTIAAGAEFTVSTAGHEGAIVDGVLTVPNVDITINVTGDVIDMAAYESAKAELEAFVEKINALKVDLFTNGAEMIAAKDAVAAVLAADAESTDATKQAIIDEAAKADVVPVLKSDAKVPYSKKALYADYMASDNIVFGIYTENDWIKLTEDYYGVNCLLDLYVMNDIEFTQKMIPLCANLAGGFKGNIYGQGYTFKNINIEYAGGDNTNQYNAVALIAACLYGDGSSRHVIDGLGLTGRITNTGVRNAGYMYTGVFVGGKNYGYNITNCWADVDLIVPYTHGTNGAYAGFVGKVDSGNGSIDNCYFSGSITSLNGNVHVFDTGVHSNFINVGTLTGTSGTPVVATTAGTNSYSVGVPYSAESAALDSAAEAAWKVNKNWTSSILSSQTYFFTVDANGELCFTKDANNVVRKVEFTGDISDAYYLKAGDTITLADVADNATFTVGGEEISGTYTVPNEDVTINVASDSSVNLIAYAAAKAELEAIVSKFGALNVDLFTNGADMTAAKEAAAAVLAADAESTDATKQAIIDEAAKADVVPALKADAKVPYSKKALYAEFGASTTVFGIYEEADWNAMVAAGENNGVTIYLMNDVTFTSANTTCINTFKGTFEGQNYTISGINITEASGRFAGLFRINQGTIKNLKLDGTMNVTIGNAEGYVESIYAGIFGGQGGTVIGCTNSVDITLTAYVGNNNNNCIGAINGYLGSVSNSINEGNMDVTLYLKGASTRVMAAGIVGRSRGAADGCTNNGALNFTIYGEAGSVYIAGIASDAVGTNAAGSVNNGAITVNGGCYNYVAGILSATGNVGAGSVAGAANNGDITVNGRAGENIRILSASGIVGQFAMPTATEAVTVSNTGDITMDAQGAAQAYAYGIAPASADNYTATNSGAIWIGGVKEADATHAVGNTYAGTTAENVAICAHSNNEINHIAETATHKFECKDCSYNAVVACTVTFTANDDLVFDAENKTVTATHTGTCADCEETYTESCVGTHDEENLKFTFDCCDREDYVYGTPACEHTGAKRYEHITDERSHNVVCDDCDEVLETVACTLVWAEDDGTKTHSATCPACTFTYTETCVGTEKSNAADCTADHWYEYDCDRADETIPGSGADAHVWGEWTTVGATEGYQRHTCDNCEVYEEELLPLAAPVIVITANAGKAGATGVEFTVTLTEAAVKAGTITIELPVWAKNVNLVAGANVTIDGNVATITGDIAAGSVLLTGTYDIDTLAGENGTITATAENILNERGEAVTVAVATAAADINVVLGDAKVDGAVNLIDAIAVLRSAAGLDLDVNEANGDVDGSGVLTADDAVLIVRFWLGDPTYNGPVLG